MIRDARGIGRIIQGMQAGLQGVVGIMQGISTSKAFRLKKTQLPIFKKGEKYLEIKLACEVVFELACEVAIAFRIPPNLTLPLSPQNMFITCPNGNSTITLFFSESSPHTFIM